MKTDPPTENTDALAGAPEGDLRRRILDGARHLLVRGGYRNLSMRRLARAIGYSATSIYLHFESKDDLFHALIDEGMEQLHARLREAVEAASADPRPCLEALCRAFICFGLDNPEYYEVMFLLRPDSMERYPPEKYRRARRNLDLAQELLRRGVEQGRFDVPEGPLMAASALWASLHGTVSLLLSRRVDTRVGPDALVEASVRQALRGVTSAPHVASAG